MRISKKGFALPLLITLIAVAAIVGGFYFYSINKQEPIKQTTDVSTTSNLAIIATNKEESKNAASNLHLKTYMQPLGFYTLTYPETWTYGESQFYSQFYPKQQETFRDLTITIDFDNENLDDLETTGTQVSKIFWKTIDNYTVYVLKINRSDGVSDDLVKYYYMPIDGRLSLFISEHLLTGDIQKEVEDYLATLKIDESKSDSILKLHDNRQNDAQSEAIMSRLMGYASSYFNKNKNYAGVCLSDELKTDLGALKYYSGDKSVICVDNINSYSISAQFKGGQYWCEDSTGFFKIVNSLNNSTICPK